MDSQDMLAKAHYRYINDITVHEPVPLGPAQTLAVKVRSSLLLLCQDRMLIQVLVSEPQHHVLYCKPLAEHVAAVLLELICSTSYHIAPVCSYTATNCKCIISNSSDCSITFACIDSHA